MLQAVALVTTYFLREIMADPTWFDAGLYLANKLMQLQTIEPEKGWTPDLLHPVRPDLAAAQPHSTRIFQCPIRNPPPLPTIFRLCSPQRDTCCPLGGSRTATG